MAVSDIIIEDLTPGTGRECPKGATVEGGDLLEGNHVAPAIVTGAGPGVLLVDEEPFTPVVAVMPYDDLDEAIAEVNRPDYGLVSYLCGAARDAPSRPPSALTAERWS